MLANGPGVIGLLGALGPAALGVGAGLYDTELVVDLLSTLPFVKTEFAPTDLRAEASGCVVRNADEAFVRPGLVVFVVDRGVVDTRETNVVLRLVLFGLQIALGIVDGVDGDEALRVIFDSLISAFAKFTSEGASD